VTIRVATARRSASPITVNVAAVIAVPDDFHQKVVPVVVIKLVRRYVGIEPTGTAKGFGSVENFYGRISRVVIREGSLERRFRTMTQEDPAVVERCREGAARILEFDHVYVTGVVYTTLEPQALEPHSVAAAASPRRAITHRTRLDDNYLSGVLCGRRYDSRY